MQRLQEILGKKVMPGDEVCTVEEFLPGLGTFEKGGIVRAAWAGMTEVDMITRTVFVKPFRDIFKIPSRETVIVGIVTVVKDEFAIIKVVGDIKGHTYPTGFTGLLHISQASDRHVKDLYEVIRVGDIVKAKVLSDSPPYNLTLKGPKFGVLLSFCGNCGSIMKKSGPDTLKCPRCGRVEKRKLSIDYGRLKGLLL